MLAAHATSGLGLEVTTVRQELVRASVCFSLIPGTRKKTFSLAVALFSCFIPAGCFVGIL